MKKEPIIFHIYIKNFDEKLEKLNKFIEICEKYPRSIILSFIPERLIKLETSNSYKSLERIFNLQKKGLVVIGQYGYQKSIKRNLEEEIKETLYKSRFNKSFNFKKLPFEEKQLAIGRGRRIISDCGLEPEVFTPPGFMFNENTIKASLLSGFNYFSNVIRSSIFPVSPYHYKIHKDNRSLILPQSKTGYGSYIMYMYYDKINKKILRRVKELCGKRKIISFDELEKYSDDSQKNKINAKINYFLNSLHLSGNRIFLKF